MHECAVIGIGNTIRSDDGVGVHVLRKLSDGPALGADLVEGMLYSMDLLPELEGRRKVVFVDGIDAGEPPGAVFRFTPDDVRPDRADPMLSLHDYSIYDLLGAAELTDCVPEEIVIVAVQVGCVDFGEELSPEVEASLGRVCELVRRELGGL